MVLHKFWSSLLLMICLGGRNVLSAMTEEVLSKPIVIECLEEQKITKEQVLELEKKGSEDYYCLRSCVLKKTEYFNKDGMVDIQKISEILKENIENEESRTEILAVMQECTKVNTAEISDGKKECVRAKLFLECLEDLYKPKSTKKT